MIFLGSAVAIVTPFKADLSPDYDAYAKLLDWQIRSGTDAVVVCGTTGESVTMSAAEQEEMLRLTVDSVQGKVPVIFGIGGNDTATVVKKAALAEKLHADALLAVTPYYNRATQEGLYQHYRAVAKSTFLPIILYNVPARTGCNIKADTVARLAEVENIVAIKEASGDISQITTIAAKTRGKMTIYSGNDDHIVPVLSVGGQGVISVLANVVPRETSKMVHDYLAGRHEEALAAQLQYLPLVNALFAENNPMPVKKALELMGLIEGHLRLPLVEVLPETSSLLRRELSALGLLAKGK